MKLATQIVLGIVIVILSYVIVQKILTPIRYQAEVEKKEAVVIEKLELIRDAQLAYKAVKGNYANNWDTLLHVMKTGQYPVVKVFGDKDDSLSDYRLETIYIPIADSLFKKGKIDSLPFKPGTSEKFVIDASEIERNQVMVPVFEVYDPSPFNVARLNADDPLKVGSLDEVNVSGNWK